MPKAAHKLWAYFPQKNGNPSNYWIRKKNATLYATAFNNMDGVAYPIHNVAHSSARTKRQMQVHLKTCSFAQSDNQSIGLVNKLLDAPCRWGPAAPS